MSNAQSSYKVELIKKEIARVNQVIDRKIVRGLPYTKESSYHKMLLGELKSAYRASSMQSFGRFFVKSARVLSTFLF